MLNSAGIVNAWRLAKSDPKDARFVFLGAGSAGVGVANQIVDVLVASHGVDRDAARQQFYFVDSQGLVASNRGGRPLAAHKLPFAHGDIDVDTVSKLKTLSDVVKHVKPTALIGLSGQGGAFDEELLKLMGEYNERPIIFALSNPTDNAECTARAAYEATDGRAVFGSGSPFDPVEINGKTLYPAQANNLYCFPPIGLGASLCGAACVSDGMIAAAVTALAATTTDEQLAQGMLYPPLSDIRQVTATVAKAVIEKAIEDGHARTPPPKDVALEEFIKGAMYTPTYIESPAKL